MSVSARSYMSAWLTVLTAGVVLSGAALVSAPGAQAVTCDNLPSEVCEPVPSVAAAPSYALTQGAILGADLVAVAADAVAVVATLVPAAVETVLSGLPLSATWQTPSVQTVLARFDADWARLQTDWNATFSVTNFRNYVEGLAAPDSVPTCTSDSSTCVCSDGTCTYYAPPAAALASAFALLPVESLPADELDVDGSASDIALDPAEVSGGSSITEPVVAGRAARGAAARAVVRGGYQNKNVVGNQGQRCAVRSASALSAPVAQAPASASAEISDSTPTAKPVNQRVARKAAR